MNSSLIYAAGLIDGEGCFNITKCRVSYVPRIMVVNTSKKIVYWLKESFGGKVYKTTVKNKPHWKPRYTWELPHQKALDFAISLEPFLKIKQKQAMHFMMWDVIRETFKQKERKPWYKILATRIKNLNKKGIYMAASHVLRHNL